MPIFVMAGVPTMVPSQVWDGARTGLSGCFVKGSVGLMEVASRRLEQGYQEWAVDGDDGRC